MSHVTRISAACVTSMILIGWLSLQALLKERFAELQRREASVAAREASIGHREAALAILLPRLEVCCP